MRVLSLAFVMFLAAAPAFGVVENILVSMATQDLHLILLNVEYSANKYRTVDSAVFALPFQAGLTSVGRLKNGNFQVVWTARDASQKIRINSMVVDKDLNQVGGVQKFKRVLGAHFNLNILSRGVNGSQSDAGNIGESNESDYTYSGIPTGGVVDKILRQGRNTFSGKLYGQPVADIILPQGFNTFDTAYWSDGAPFTEEDFYFALGQIEESGRYGVLFGSSEDPTYTSAFQFTGVVQSATMLPDLDTDNFNFIVWEELDNPTRYRVVNRLIDGPTGQPEGNLIVHVAPRPGDLATFPYFNIITSVSSEQPDGGHVFFVNPPNGDIVAYHANTETGKKNSGFSPITNENRVLYGLDALLMSSRP